MLKRCAAAKHVVCGGCHELFRRFSATINQIEVCYNYYCTTPDDVPVAGYDIQRSQHAQLSEGT
jgi:hypothetical protein